MLNTCVMFEVATPQLGRLQYFPLTAGLKLPFFSFMGMTAINFQILSF